VTGLNLSDRSPIACQPNSFRSFDKGLALLETLEETREHDEQS